MRLRNQCLIWPLPFELEDFVIVLVMIEGLFFCSNFLLLNGEAVNCKDQGVSLYRIPGRFNLDMESVGNSLRLTG
jgi:hypothetical protein